MLCLNAGLQRLKSYAVLQNVWFQRQTLCASSKREMHSVEIQSMFPSQADSTINFTKTPMDQQEMRQQQLFKRFEINLPNI